MTPRRICLWGLFGQQNLGNECTLQAILHNLRRCLPQAEAVCVCTIPEDTSARHHIAAFPITDRFRPAPAREVGRRRGRVPVKLARGLRRMGREVVEVVRAFRLLSRTDMVVVPGTGFLTDASTGALGWPYEIFKWAVIAKLCGCRLLYVSVGAGPIHGRLSRWLIRSALSLADFRSYRDESTRKHLADIGLAVDQDRVYPDLAFNLPEDLLPRPNGDARHGVVGVGLMTYSEGGLVRPGGVVYRPYLEAVVDFVTWLLAGGYDVRLLVGDLLYDDRVQREFAEALRERLPAGAPAPARLIDEPIASVEDLLSQLAATDFVVATRFHNVLLALLLDKPVISISFHHKCASLMQAMGLSDYCQDIHDLDVQRLIEQFGELERRRRELRPMIRRKTAEFRKKLDEQYASIFAA